MKRREFLQAAAVPLCGMVAAAGMPGDAAASPPGGAGNFKGTLCLFSKHLPGLDWRDLARATRDCGFAGVDLTVRPQGHVLPGRVAQDLPKAVEAIRAQGLEVPFITTDLTSTSDPAAGPTLRTAASLGIRRFKPGYYQYKFVDVKQEIARAGAEFRGLVELGAHHGVECGFHNHEGYIGGPVWDFAPVIESTDPRHAGFYFDVRHATAEGGVGGWRSAVNLAAPRLKMAAMKDFYWAKTAKGWKTVNCPLGRGMVRWKDYFAALARAGFQGPVSLHLEYDMPGKTPAGRQASVLAAARRDLAFLKAGLEEAYA